MQPILALPPGTSAATAEELEQQLAGGSSSSSQGMVQLQDALAAAEQHLAVLTDENERLMELSNSLRAENEQLKRSRQVRVVPCNACRIAAVCAASARPQHGDVYCVICDSCKCTC
jgi:small-conductance mechanosensitive channel